MNLRGLPNREAPAGHKQGAIDACSTPDCCMSTFISLLQRRCARCCCCCCRTWWGGARHAAATAGLALPAVLWPSWQVPEHLDDVNMLYEYCSNSVRVQWLRTSWRSYRVSTARLTLAHNKFHEGDTSDSDIRQHRWRLQSRRVRFSSATESLPGCCV
jgi:hypothetical protein